MLVWALGDLCTVSPWAARVAIFTLAAVAFQADLLQSGKILLGGREGGLMPAVLHLQGTNVPSVLVSIELCPSLDPHSELATYWLCLASLTVASHEWRVYPVLPHPNLVPSLPVHLAGQPHLLRGDVRVRQAVMDVALVPDPVKATVDQVELLW